MTRWTAAALSLAAAACLDAPPSGTGEDDGNTALLAAFRFEEDPGFLADSSGNGHDGTCDSCPSATVARDDVGGAAQFDGLDDLVGVEPFGTGSFTVMMWLRVDIPLGEDLGCPASKPFGAEGTNSWQLCVSNTGDGQVALTFYTSGDSNGLWALGEMELGTWHHAAIRWNGDEKSIWWDGNMRATQREKTEFDDGPILIGGDIDGVSTVAMFSGAIDDLEIHLGALSGAAIEEAAQP